MLQGLQNSQSAKRSKFEQAKVDACLQTIRAADCATLNMTNHLSGVPGCDTFATPLVSVGGRCDNDYECIDSYCKVPKDPDPPGPGVCTAGAAAGQSCATDPVRRGPDVRSAAGLDNPPTTSASHPPPTAPRARSGYQCASGVCSSSSTGGGLTCMADTRAKCFYSSGCSVAGGAPGLVALMLFGGFAAITIARKRRSRR